MAASTLITVAPTGAEADKAAVPALPVTLDELVGTAKECQAAGAAVIHVHIRDGATRPTLDPDRLAGTAALLRDNGVEVEIDGDDLIVQGRGRAPGGGLVTTHMDHRLAMSALVMGLASERHQWRRRRYDS